MSKGIEGDLLQLETSLRQLEFEYDQFFSGQQRALPLKTEQAVQALIRTYSGRAIQNPSLRFRYTNLVARFNSFKRVWDRRVREVEEGRVFGRPLKAAVPPPRRAPASTEAPSRFLASDLRSDEGAMKNIFDSYRRMRAECGESTQRLRLENFTRILAEKVEKMKKTKKCEQVEIHLRKDQDKTRIVVRPHREKTSST